MTRALFGVIIYVLGIILTKINMKKFLIFLVGVVLGALVVGLLFYYGVVSPQDSGSSLYKAFPNSFYENVLEFQDVKDLKAWGDPSGY